MNRKFGVVRKVICFVVTLFVSLYLMQSVGIAAENCTISQTVSQSECEQGEAFTLSVFLGGLNGSVSVSEIRGKLEYDTTLFTLIGVSTTSMTLSDFDDAQGLFTLSSETVKNLKEGDLLFQIQMEVRVDSSVGETTICVNNVELASTGENISIVNMVPSSIHILQADELNDEEEPEEAQPEGEEFEKEEPEEKIDSSGTGSADGEKDSNKSSATKTSESGTKTNGEAKAVNKRDANKSTKSSETKQLDKNYKTDAGLGNGWYFVFAFGFGAAALAGYLVYRKLSGKYIRE